MTTHASEVMHLASQYNEGLITLTELVTHLAMIDHDLIVSAMREEARQYDWLSESIVVFAIDGHGSFTNLLEAVKRLRVCNRRMRQLSLLSAQLHKIMDGVRAAERLHVR